MSGLGPQTQAGGFNFAHSQLDSQPNYSFADLTQDGASYDGFADFSGLTQVLITGLRDTQAWMFRLVGTLSAHSVLPMRCMFVHDSTSLVLQDPASQAAWQDAIQASALVCRLNAYKASSAKN